MTEMDMSVVFRTEASELLEELEAALLKLEANPADSGGIGLVFRVIHTLKGSAGMAGYQEIVRFTHDVETIFDRVRKGELAIDQTMFSLALRTKDHLQVLLATAPEGDDSVVRESDQLLAEFRRNAGMAEKIPAGAADDQTQFIDLVGNTGGGPGTWWIRYQPAIGSMLTNPLGLLAELNDLGRMVCVMHMDPPPGLEAFQPEQVISWWDILLNTEQGLDEIRQLFIFMDEQDRLHITRIAEGTIRDSDLNELLNELRRHMENSDLGKVREALLAISRGHAEKRKKRKPTGAPPVAATETDTGSIRVDSARLDKLVDMMGELVILQSRMSMISKQFEHPLISQLAEDFERLTTVMRNNALGLRMMPIGAAFGALRRMVRDLSLSLGKEIELVTEGEETKLDKTVLDRLKDPLMHILRNAIDHGIETPAERVATGKSTGGVIRLAATTASGEVTVTISDDGRGIDPERIRRKAGERGLIAPDHEMSDGELLNLIFEPGFSTAEQVSDVSGRGVGMDVVKKRIDDLRGRVEIQSAVGTGSTFTIRLPLTLAIIDGMMVQIGRETFIIPLAFMKACQERLVTGEEKEVDSLERMGHLIPCISLRRQLKVPGTPPEYERVIIVHVDGMTVGLAVDQVIGRQQAVIKSLGRVYKKSTWISGTSINGDGTISLILDVLQLVRHVANRTTHHTTTHATIAAQAG